MNAWRLQNSLQSKFSVNTSGVDSFSNIHWPCPGRSAPPPEEEASPASRALPPFSPRGRQPRLRLRGRAGGATPPLPSPSPPSPPPRAALCRRRCLSFWLILNSRPPRRNARDAQRMGGEHVGTPPPFFQKIVCSCRTHEYNSLPPSLVVSETGPRSAPRRRPHRERRRGPLLSARRPATRPTREGREGGRMLPPPPPRQRRG